MISCSQIALVHVAKKKLGLPEDVYRAILLRHGGVESAKDLDAAGFNAVMLYFWRCGFKSDWMKRTYGNRAGMATAPQVRLIKDLWRDYTGQDDERALDRWLDRSFHITALRFATPDIARNAITGLKKMIARKGQSGAGGNGSPSPAA